MARRKERYFRTGRRPTNLGPRVRGGDTKPYPSAHGSLTTAPEVNARGYRRRRKCHPRERGDPGGDAWPAGKSGISGQGAALRNLGPRVRGGDIEPYPSAYGSLTAAPAVNARGFRRRRIQAATHGPPERAVFPDRAPPNKSGPPRSRGRHRALSQRIWVADRGARGQRPRLQKAPHPAGDAWPAGKSGISAQGAAQQIWASAFAGATQTLIPAHMGR